jgi:hypothetical protein
MKSQLENEPVFATIGDEEVRLEHIDITTDIPPQKTFLRVLDLTKESQDWKNLPPLLEGLARVKGLPAQYQQRFITAAAEADMISVVLNCLRQAEYNGFSLKTPVVRLSMFHAIRKSAREADWEEEATQKCLKQVQQVLDMMEDPAHCGQRVVTPDDPRAQPYVIAIPLEIAAMRAKSHLNGVDEGDLVAAYTTRLLSALEQPGNDLVRLPLTSRKPSLTHVQVNDEHWQLPDTSNLTGRKGQGAPVRISTKLDKLLQEFLPVRSALDLAQEVLGSSLPKESLDTIESSIDKIDTRLKWCVHAMLEQNQAVLKIKKMDDKYAYPSMKEALEVLAIPA